MAKVYMFPEKKRLPKCIEKRLNEITKEYIEVLQALVVLLDVDVSDDQQYDEVLLMVQEAFARGILAAVEEME
jgi:hypothetical protein